MKQSDFIGIVEAAYNTEGPDAGSDEGWLRGVLAALRPTLDQGLGVLGWFHDLREMPAVPKLTVLDGPAAMFERLSQQADNVGGDLLRKAMSTAPVSTMRVSLGVAVLDPMLRAAEASAMIDSLGLFCQDSDGHGMGIAAHSPRVVSLARRDILRWQRLVAHLTAGFRLRRRHGATEAVLAPSGKLVHAEGAARSPRAREVLRAAAIDFDRARRRGGDVDEALDLYRALIAGRWTLVDLFERDGKRYAIARQNTPAPPPAPELTVRETQVAVFTAIGHPIKMISYELGLSESSITTYLRRALVKLRLPDRLALAARFSFIGHPAPQGGSSPPTVQAV